VLLGRRPVGRVPDGTVGRTAQGGPPERNALDGHIAGGGQEKAFRCRKPLASSTKALLCFHHQQRYARGSPQHRADAAPAAAWQSDENYQRIAQRPDLPVGVAEASSGRVPHGARTMKACLTERIASVAHTRAALRAASVPPFLEPHVGESHAVAVVAADAKCECFSIDRSTNPAWDNLPTGCSILVPQFPQLRGSTGTILYGLAGLFTL
jgi:hypothetical protein